MDGGFKNKEMKALQYVHNFTFNLGDNNAIEELQATIIKSLGEQEDKIFIAALRTMAKPPIKGEITKGKVKWRGITLHQNYNGVNMTRQLYQRGEPISPIVTFAFPYNIFYDR